MSMIVQFSMKEAFRDDGKCTIQIEYNRNLQIHGSRYVRRRSRSKVLVTIVKFWKIGRFENV